ncbi:hypothetical protein FNH22_29600 [Fulvivirga sp. M361]|uniref:hypothetical protein n=1 Tax=Fulvivirga sp. M361 TaxID=2594266 RepID=UPI00117A4DD1|nr:hypothetical protein [Fulvivirga sp. M361]TRX48211.1 hypothetical protein FNH22_29600 [Fulvivirga sp. M361]
MLRFYHLCQTLKASISVLVIALLLSACVGRKTVNIQYDSNIPQVTFAVEDLNPENSLVGE